MSSWDAVTYASCRPAWPDLRTGKVIKVYDGDTVTIGTQDMVRHSCRLSGIDTAELRTRDKVEKARAYASRDFLRSRVMDKIVDITVNGVDKYGRVLCVISFEGVNINELMIEKGGAVEYEGGSKPRTNWANVPAACEAPASKLGCWGSLRSLFC